jgi:hypothetical protein
VSQGDCDDGDPAVHPDATERCNGVDDDCDGVADEADAVDAQDFWVDGDGDGFGDPGERVRACDQPSGAVGDAGDCDDGDPAVHPVATERCNGVDDDCDGVADEADAVDAGTWYRDEDGDGFGDADHLRQACEAPAGYAAAPGDCDDGDPSVNPAAADEQRDGVDADCDGVDEPVDLADTGRVSLVFAELMPNPAEDLGEAGQWLELRNTGAWDLDLEGLWIHHHQRPMLGVEEPVVLAAGEVLLVARSADVTSNGGLEPDLVGQGFALEPGAGTYRLVHGSTVLDSVAYGSAWVSPWRPGYSLALDHLADDPDDNDDADSWCLGLEPYGPGGTGSPGEPNGACPGSLEDADGDGFTSALYLGEDCDDFDPDRYPGAPEDCGDGLDQDCDGLVDCLDEACWGDAPCEICDDGLDDDGDGLVDCEDGDCAGNPACEELDCSDGLDSDSDGLVDCDDDDCWHGACHPGGVAARVHGGTMVQRNAGYRELQRWRAGAFAWTSTQLSYQHRASLSSVQGTVQVLPPGASSWEGTTARTTCSWSLASAAVSFAMVRTHDTWIFEAPVVTRGALTVTPGCRVDGSWFLPSEVLPWAGLGLAGISWHGSRFTGGTSWYRGSALGPAWSSSSTGASGSPHGGLEWIRWSHSSSLVVLLSPGQSWRAGP